MLQERDALSAVQWFHSHSFTFEPTDDGSTDTAPPVSSPRLLSLSSSSGMQLPVRELAVSMSSLAAFALHSRSLTSLKLWNNNLGAEGASLLAPAIVNLPNLLVISLGCNSIGARGVKALGPALTTSRSSDPVLQKLDLTQNSLADAGINALVPFLSKLARLRSLSLISNGVTDSGVKQLGSSLTKLHSSLRELDFSSNSFGALGTEALGQQLEQLPDLRQLHLNSNRDMSSQGRYALWPDICNLSSLQAWINHPRLLLCLFCSAFLGSLVECNSFFVCPQYCGEHAIVSERVGTAKPHVTLQFVADCTTMCD